MPTATSTKWKAARNDVRAPEHTIVKLTDGTDTWYFSDIEMILTDGHVYGLLTSVSPITTGVDFFSRKWLRPELKITLSNLRYRKKDGVDQWNRLGDDLKNLHGTVAEIYYMRGERINALADCLKRFTGQVIFQPEYTEDKVVVTVYAADKFIDKTLPVGIVSDSYSDAPIDSLPLKKPIVYGEFKFDYNDSRNDLGLAVAVLLVELVGFIFVVNGRYLISDHVLNTNDELFITTKLQPGFMWEMHDAKITRNVNESGDGTSEISSLLSKVVVYPNEDFAGDFLIDGDQKYIRDHLNARDRNPSTYAKATDFIDEGSGPTDQSEVIAYFSFPDLGTGDGDNLPALPSSFLFSPPLSVDVLLEVRLESESGVLWDAGDALNPTLYYYHDTNGTDSRVTIMEFSDAELGVSGGTLKSIDIAGITNINNKVGWHLRTGQYTAPAGTQEPALFLIAGRTNDNTDKTLQGDGITDNQNLLRIYTVRLLVTQVMSKEAMDFPVAWAACKGREYGSWITGRSSAYVADALIEDPVGIIESILRDELGRVNADLDLPSFITGENTSVKARINLYEKNQMSALTAVRQIAEQSTLMFLFGADGLARCIDLTNKTPTTNRIIPYSHIKGGHVKVSKTATIRNKMTIKSRWRAEVGKYSDIETVEDTTSTGDAKIGDRTYSASWQNIAGTSKDAVSANLVNNTDGIWSKQHEAIELATFGTMHADLFEGDWIELEASSVDHHLLFYGASWSGKQFVILKITQGDNETKIKAVKVW